MWRRWICGGGGCVGGGGGVWAATESPHLWILYVFGIYGLLVSMGGDAVASSMDITFIGIYGLFGIYGRRRSRLIDV